MSEFLFIVGREIYSYVFWSFTNSNILMLQSIEYIMITLPPLSDVIIMLFSRTKFSNAAMCLLDKAKVWFGFFV